MNVHGQKLYILFHELLVRRKIKLIIYCPDMTMVDWALKSQISICSSNVRNRGGLAVMSFEGDFS